MPPEPNSFSPPMANYERPKPVEQSKAPPAPPAASAVQRLIVGDAAVVVSVVPVEDSVPLVTLQHEYEGFEPENEFVRIGEADYLLLHRDGQTLILEAA